MHPHNVGSINTKAGYHGASTVGKLINELGFNILMIKKIILKTCMYFGKSFVTKLDKSGHSEALGQGQDCNL